MQVLAAILADMVCHLSLCAYKYELAYAVQCVGRHVITRAHRSY